MNKCACRISVKTRTCFHGFTYVFLGIHVRVFRKTCTNKKQVWKNIHYLCKSMNVNMEDDFDIRDARMPEKNATPSATIKRIEIKRPKLRRISM